MAAAAPSSLASSVEKTNGAKLRRLLIDGGATILRNVFDSYHPPANLAADLNANYLTLHNLLKKNVLHTAQWDQLFPPGGAAPDSRTFDFTLLFLLLTNICGLSPPPSGWHIKPSPSDPSTEANLARITFFCNDLYDYVSSTTSVDSHNFTCLWQEISAGLVDLGLNQEEIDRLKTEHCGEEDYLNVLPGWADSEGDSKSKLRGIHQYQTESQDLAKVHQIQLEDGKTQENAKTKLAEVHQIQTKTQQDVEKVLQDNKSKLDEVYQSQIKKEQIVEHFKAVEAGLREIKLSVGSLKLQEERNRESETDKVLRNLAKSEFKGDIEYYVERFQEGTREWVFNKVQNWLDDRNSPNRVMVISANAGMGKSVISAVVCKRMQEAGRLLGSHFCQHNNTSYRNPQLMLQSLACHLAHALPEYKQALVNKLSRNLGKDLNTMDVWELFALLFKEPLSIVANPERNMVMVIDGLDESEFQERNELLDVIANHFCKLPPWIRFLCTTRPERNITEALKLLKPFKLEPNEEENVKDIKLFFETKMQYLMKPENKGSIVEKLAEKSDGLMLYAHFLVSFIKEKIEENVSVLDQGDLDGSLPLAISSVYHSYFKRLEHELIKELGVKEENFLNLLCAVTASREPLPIDFVSKVLVPNANSPVARRKVLKAIGSVSSLLPIRDGCLHVIHKSVKDWLTDTSCYGEHDFIMEEKEGHRILASLCSDELHNLKQRHVRCKQFSPTEKYALQHGVRHMLELDANETLVGECSLEECVQGYVIDLELLYAKLCMGDSLAAEDILWLEREDIFQELCDNTQGLLKTLKLLLRNHFYTFKKFPHLFFPTVLNEGGTELSCVASKLLESKCLEIPYMEFVHKEWKEKGVLANFQCSSQVACLDVSPGLELMVCECADGKIQLWEIFTGKLVWTRFVMVEKSYSFRAFRRPLSSSALSFYRSVVFHPTANVVLPGVLSHAYTFNGDLKPLFPESNCKFTVCSISGDKTLMLTDCPDNSKCIIMWSLKNGSEISRIARNEDILSFAWSRDGNLLAISHSTGSISIVDALDGFRILAETVIPKVCGMIKFSPDCRHLFCLSRIVVDELMIYQGLFRLNTNMAEFCGDFELCKPYMPWKFELPSKAGFLLGDPILYQGMAFAFVLHEHTVLKGNPSVGSIDILDINAILEGYFCPSYLIEFFSDIVFSLSGETVYAVGRSYQESPVVSAWDVASMKLIAMRYVETKNCIFDASCMKLMTKTDFILAAVREGVLLKTEYGTLNFWNFDLSECIQSWTCISAITKMIPISEERVACEAESKVFILDISSREIVSTISTSLGSLLACNSKYQLLAYKFPSLHLSDDKTTLWKKAIPVPVAPEHPPFGMFSPSEQFVVISLDGQQAHVLDALSGKPLHMLRQVNSIYDCKFVTDEEFVVYCKTASGVHCLQLLNIKSGDLLSRVNLNNKEHFLAACPLKRLLAACPSEHLVFKYEPSNAWAFNLIQVHLPQDRDRRKRKR